MLKSIGGSVWGNILAGGIIGWGVDASTGAQYNLKPGTIFVSLEVAGGDSTALDRSRSSEGIAKLNELDEMLESNLISEEEYTESRRNVLRNHFPDMVLDEED